MVRQEKRFKKPNNIHNKSAHNNYDNNMLSVFNHCLTTNNMMKRLKSAIIQGETSTHLIGGAMKIGLAFVLTVALFAGAWASPRTVVFEEYGRYN